MKKTLILLTILIMTGSVVKSQEWKEIKFPSDETINGVSMLSPDTIFVVTTTGKIARTLDGGANWVVNDFKSSVSWEEIKFTDILNGYICGSNGSIYKTINGGANWVNISLKDTSLWVFDVEFVDQNTAFTVAMKHEGQEIVSNLYKTVDGGTTWTKLKDIGIGYADIEIDPNGKVFILSFGKISMTTDMGKSWNSILTPEGAPGRSISVLGNSIMICGLNGLVQLSTDNGEQWVQSANKPGAVFIRCQLVHENEGYFSGMDKTFMRVSDDGRKWDNEELPKKVDIHDFDYKNGVLIAVGTGGSIFSKKVD